MRYTDIPVHIGDKRLFVTYDYIANSSPDTVCSITAEGKNLVIDEAFNIIRNDMPKEWIGPIIEELKKIIAGQGM